MRGLLPLRRSRSKRVVSTWTTRSTAYGLTWASQEEPGHSLPLLHLQLEGCNIWAEDASSNWDMAGCMSAGTEQAGALVCTNADHVARHEGLLGNSVISRAFTHCTVRQDGVGRKGQVSGEQLRVKLYYELSIKDRLHIRLPQQK